MSMYSGDHFVFISAFIYSALYLHGMLRRCAASHYNIVALEIWHVVDGVEGV